MSKKQQPDFEKSLVELEGIVTSMERGEMSLEESLETFERGVSLARMCQKTLNEAQLRVEKLLDFDDPEQRETVTDDE